MSMVTAMMGVIFRVPQPTTSEHVATRRAYRATVHISAADGCVRLVVLWNVSCHLAS